MKIATLILGLLLPWLAEAQQQYYQSRVSSLALSGSDTQDDLDLLPIRVDSVLTPENLRASIQALYDTGHYSYVEVDATSASAGAVSLTFRVRHNYYFSTFRVEPDNLLDESLSSHFRLPIGEKYTPSEVDRLVQETTELFRSQGYFQATVTPEYTTDDKNHLIAVTFKVTAG